MAIDCLRIKTTHLIEFECLDVNGAAKQASPTFTSSYCSIPNKLFLFSSLCYSDNFFIISIFLPKGIDISDFKSSIFFLNFFSFYFNYIYFFYVSEIVVVPITATPTSAVLKPPISFVPSPAYRIPCPVNYFIFLTIVSLSWGDVLAKIVMCG